MQSENIPVAHKHLKQSNQLSLVTLYITNVIMFNTGSVVTFLIQTYITDCIVM